jgi:phenylacetate-coenzyme A ligase PaaK-like adenylate-forming protein
VKPPPSRIRRLDDWAAACLGLPRPLSRDGLDAARLDRLNRLIARLRRASPFHRARGDLPERPFASLAEIASLGFTTPADLVRADPPLLAVSQGSVDRVVTLPTSGTSGAPKRIAFSAADRAATVDFFTAGMGLFTEAGDRVAFLFPAERPGGVGNGLGEAVRRLAAEPLAIPIGPVDEMVARLRHERPTVLAGPPVAILAAARRAGHDGGERLAVRAVLVSSDRAGPAMKRAIATALGAEVHDHWGMTETGFGGAVDCACHDGLHLREPDLLVEIVDPVSGRPLPTGEVGEIVVTTLAHEAMPLLRYRTGDRGRLMPGGCACGSVLARLDPAIERFDEAIALVGGTVISPAALDERLFGFDAVGDVGLEAVGDPADRLIVRIRTVAGAGDADLAARLRAAVIEDSAVAAAIARGGLMVELGFVETPPSLAKRRVVRTGAARSGGSG